MRVRVLITGGLGFLGRAVTAELADAGHDVTVLSHTSTANAVGSVPIVKADLRDRERLQDALASRSFEGVCHLAALASARESFADPLGYFETNVMGTVNLLRAVGDGVRVVMTSTNSVYGSSRPGRPTEYLPLHAENPYAASKIATEQALTYTAGTGTVGATILRCFNIAGAFAGQTDLDPTRIIPNTLRAAAKQIPHVTVNGDGTAVREFTHVLEVADAMRLAVEATEVGKHQTFNVGTGRGVSMTDIIRTAESVTGQAIQVVHKPAAPEAHSLVADPSKLVAGLGWRASRSSLERILTDAWNAFPR